MGELGQRSAVFSQENSRLVFSRELGVSNGSKTLKGLLASECKTSLKFPSLCPRRGLQRKMTKNWGEGKGRACALSSRLGRRKSDS